MSERNTENCKLKGLPGGTARVSCGAEVTPTLLIWATRSRGPRPKHPPSRPRAPTGAPSPSVFQRSLVQTGSCPTLRPPQLKIPQGTPNSRKTPRTSFPLQAGAALCPQPPSAPSNHRAPTQTVPLLLPQRRPRRHPQAPPTSTPPRGPCRSSNSCHFVHDAYLSSPTRSRSFRTPGPRSGPSPAPSNASHVRDAPSTGGRGCTLRRKRWD